VLCRSETSHLEFVTGSAPWMETGVMVEEVDWETETWR